MKYDDASWHYGGDFPDGLPVEAGATHIGMFVAWSLLNDLGGSIWTEEFPEELEALRKREVTPGQFLIESCDEKFVDEELNNEGNAFAAVYFQGSYLSDYDRVLADNLQTCYHVADTWENFEKLSPVLAQRFEQWKNGELKEDAGMDFEIAEKKPWWRLW